MGKRPRSPPLSPASDASDDVFEAAARRAAEEEAAILARRARLRALPMDVVPVVAGVGVAVGGKGKGGSEKGNGRGKGKGHGKGKGKEKAKGKRAHFDMFSDAPVPGLGSGGGKKGADADVDGEGYARLVPGEKVGGRYVVGGVLGKGVFSSVYAAVEGESGRSVAIKVVRDNDVMRRAALREVDFLKRIEDADPMGRGHCVHMLGHFVHGGHVCVVFENLDMNLRDVVKRFGAGKGIRLGAVRLYASQLLAALHLLGRLGIVHADVKPDNALVNKDKAVVKLCDFGSAIDDLGEVDPSPYVVSRFYRAPEVLLGLPYSRAIDMWSVACVLYELYTGHIAFPGRNNNDMLRLFLIARGSMPPRLIRKALFRDRHYDADGQFLLHELDPVTGAVVVKPTVFPLKPKVDIMREAVLAAAELDEEKHRASDFADLLDAMLALDPSKRITPSAAMKMPFFTSARDP